MRRTMVLAGMSALVLFGAACATTGETASRGNPSEITQAEIEASTHTNAYELIRSARPRWLTVRGQTSLGTTTRDTPTGPVTEMALTDIMVYLDGTRLGGSDVLAQISTRDIARLQRLSAAEATQRFGVGHTQGAILVTTR